MKKYFIVLTIFANYFIHAQESKYQFTHNGFTDYVVTKKEGKLANEMYSKTLEWIGKNYRNPDVVILSKIENDYIRFQGVQQDLFCTTNCQKGQYEIEVSFKDGKYKFDVISLQQYINGWVPVDFHAHQNFYFDQNGLKKKFSKYNLIPAFFNKLNTSLSDYISGLNPKDDW